MRSLSKSNADKTAQPKRNIPTPERREQLFLRHAKKFTDYWALMSWRPIAQEKQSAPQS